MHSGRSKLVSLLAMAVTLAACSSETSTSTQAEATADAAADKGPAAIISAGGVDAIAPTAEQLSQLQLDYKPYSALGQDGLLVIPTMQPVPAVGLRLTQPGKYEVARAQEDCAAQVNVVQGDAHAASGSVTPLTQIARAITISVDQAPTYVQIAMDPAAKNNWFCNVVVRKVG